MKELRVRIREEERAGQLLDNRDDEDSPLSANFVHQVTSKERPKSGTQFRATNDLGTPIRVR